MAWTESRMFREWVATLHRGGAGYDGVDEASSLKVALYDNDITPDRDATLANTGFNTGVWAISGNEVTDATNWVSGGVVAANVAVSVPSTGVCMLDADDTTHSSTVTLTNAFGCLVYDDDMTTSASVSIADQGMTYHYFGGGQSVTAGTFTIVWHANGLWRITV